MAYSEVVFLSVIPAEATRKRESRATGTARQPWGPRFRGGDDKFNIGRLCRWLEPRGPAARSGVKPTNHASRQSLVVPALPAIGLPTACTTLAVPLSTTPCNIVTIW